MARNSRHDKLPATAQRKDDLTTKVEVMDEIIQRQLAKEKNLYPLRVSKTTVIYVTKDKQNKEYADRYLREKMKVRL